VISAGPTHEPIDPVRFLGNRSSGRMGFELAREALLLGASVTLVSGPTCLPSPAGVDLVPVTTAAQMAAAVQEQAAGASIVVMAAAVADYTPETTATEKLKKSGQDGLTLRLGRTQDILAGLGAAPAPRPLLIGFAAETSEVEARGRDKLERKGADLVIANAVGGDGVGMGGTENEVLAIGRDGAVVPFGPAPKERVATFIWDRIRCLAEQAGS
jgi:phosphopantothenoylcysteine decarboxylase/phosphopantothenate--cysteine ligase